MYQAIIARPDQILPHPNADRLKIFIFGGVQLVTGIDTPDNELGLLFGSDGQLSEEFCKQNDLIGYSDPITGEKKGGYFPKSRRVRAQAFRGEKSDGYFCALSCISYTGVDLSTLKEGFSFTELNGHEICNKYITPATLKAAGQKKVQKQNKCFAKHVETEQWRDVKEIPENSIIYITEKLHGTSGRYGRVQVDREGKRSIFDRLLRRRARTFQTYTYLSGTRNVVLAENHEGSFYGDESFRRNAVKNLELHKGEVIYFELVGYTTEGKTIMPSHNIKAAKDKSLKQYGDKMIYKYGCGEKESRLYIYRITRVNEDGIAIDLSWPQIKQRCKELGLDHVPELHSPIILDADFDVFRIPPYEFPGMEDMQHLLPLLEEGSSTLDKSHIREGIVLRVESEYGIDFFKSKSYNFKVLEGIIKEQDDYIDMEEIS